jgi:RecA/RadA recombinase
MFGNPETTTGGRALKFYATVRPDIRRIAAIKDGDAAIGNRAEAWRRAKFCVLLELDFENHSCRDSC